MSPREYQARIDLLRVQDYLWARMKPADIARKLGKDKAWVTRAIQKLESERATAYRSPEERQLISENVRQLESLLAKALAISHGGSDVKTQLAAIRTAADVIRQKSEYEMVVGFVQRRGEQGAGDAEKDRQDAESWRSLRETHPPEAVANILEKLVESRAKRAKWRARREAQKATAEAATKGRLSFAPPNG